MGQPLLHAKQHDHAAAWISRAIQQNPTADYLAALATAPQHQGKLAEALKALDQAIKLKADDAGLWEARGSLCAELKLASEALRSFQHALKLDPHNCDVAGQCDGALQDGTLAGDVPPFRPSHRTPLPINERIHAWDERHRLALVAGSRRQSLVSDVRLFRQRNAREYDGVLDQVRSELQQLIASR